MQSLLPNTNRSSSDRHTFFLVMMTVLLVYLLFFQPQPQRPNVDQPIVPPNQAEKEQANEEKKTDSAETVPDIAETEAAPGWITLGSLDPESPYRMLVTLTNQGAAPSRIELNTPKYRDVQELSGYLGQIVADQKLSEDAAQSGVTVQVIGKGTPAEVFGLKASDKIVKIAFNNRNTRQAETVEVKTFADLRGALLNTKPNDFVDLTVLRDGKQFDQRIKLGQYPMDIIRPETAPKNYDDYRLMGGLRGVEEQSDQLSFLTTLQQVDDIRLDLPSSQQISNSALRGMIPPDPTLAIELDNVNLRTRCWEIVSASEDKAVFRCAVPHWNLEFTKTFQLQKKEEAEDKQAGTGYELTLNVAVKNLDTKPHKVAYQLDGPTGLPLEGGWYAYKTGPGWGMYGIRDLVVRLNGNENNVVANNEINIDKVEQPWIDTSPDYIGVDSLFFQCTLKPNKTADEQPWHSKIFPIRVGVKNTDWSKLTDVSYRLWSKEKELQPNETLEHSYTLFAGPKDTAILAKYGLGETISYGWFWFAAMPLLGILHFFHSLGMSYALAIVALTICVRLLLFPLSIKQAIGSIKMAAIQPELKALAEKYKDDLQARSRAQSELFKKHGYHPLSGCLPLFIQLPIFIGLYKALSVDAGLYGTPLFSSSIRWCNDLSAPDKLCDWSGFWSNMGWTSFNTGQSLFALGPYFNLLPLLTVSLILAQMIFTMPPPTDDQSRMQQKMMKFMMLFMGFMFFKIPSGMCLYFIVSTVWGLLERRFIPKAKTQPNVSETTYEVKPTESKYPTVKKEAKTRVNKTPPKPEGTLAKWWREVLEKAAEQQKLGRSDKEKKRKKK
jgi:YidC/Oxa1 family membrane protein insertase